MDGDVEMAACDAVGHPGPKRKAMKPTDAAAKKIFCLRSATKSSTGKTLIEIPR